MKLYQGTHGMHHTGISRPTSLPTSANDNLVTVIVGTLVNRRNTSDTVTLLKAIAAEIEDEIRTDSL